MFEVEWKICYKICYKCVRAEKEMVTVYREMYLGLFNAITKALEELERGRSAQAETILITAQQAAEEVYLESEDEPDAD